MRDWVIPNLTDLACFQGAPMSSILFGDERPNYTRFGKDIGQSSAHPNTVLVLQSVASFWNQSASKATSLLKNGGQILDFSFPVNLGEGIAEIFA